MRHDALPILSCLTCHRTYNRHGESFDVGETFAGVPFDVGVEAAQTFSALAREYVPQASPAQVALRWILDQEGVSTVISGGRNTTQVKSNNQAADLAPPSTSTIT